MSTPNPATPPSAEDVLRVSGSSNVNNVASAIAHALYEHGQVSVRAIGAGAINQAIKAIAAARGYVAPRGLDLYLKPGFEEIDDANEGKKISAITFRCYVDR